MTRLEKALKLERAAITEFLANSPVPLHYTVTDAAHSRLAEINSELCKLYSAESEREALELLSELGRPGTDCPI